MNTTAIRETAAPWFLRQAEFDGVAIVLARHPRDGVHGFAGSEYAVGFGDLPWLNCTELYGGGCDYSHHFNDYFNTDKFIYYGDSLEEAEAAYAELERKLLAGELP